MYYLEADAAIQTEKAETERLRQEKEKINRDSELQR